MKNLKKHTMLPAWSLLLSALLAACSLSPGKPTISPEIGPTLVPGSTEETQKPAITQELTQPTPTQTRPSYLDIDENLIKGVTLEFLHPWTNDANNAIQALVSEFNKNNQWAIRVNATGFGGEEALFDALKERLEASTMPDVVAISPYLVQVLDGDYLWLDISQYITDEKWGLDKDTLDAIPNVFLDYNRVEGKVIGLPFGMNGSFLMYNLTWAEELGYLEPPNTIEALQEQLCAAAATKMNDNDIANNGTGGMWINNSPSAVYAWTTAFGEYALNTIGPASYNNQGTAQSFGFIKDMFNRSCAWIGREPTPYDYFATRYTLAYPASLTDLQAQEIAFERSGNQDQWVLIPYPTVDGKGSWVVEGNSLIIKVAKPETQMAGWLFVRWLTSSAAQEVFTRASLLWPAQFLSETTMGEVSRAHAQFNDLIPAIDKAQPSPNYPQWDFDKLLLQDAFWQFLTGYQQEHPDVLSTLDAMIEEMYELRYGN